MTKAIASVCFKAATALHLYSFCTKSDLQSMEVSEATESPASNRLYSISLKEPVWKHISFYTVVTISILKG